MRTAQQNALHSIANPRRQATTELALQHSGAPSLIADQTIAQIPAARQ